MINYEVKAEDADHKMTRGNGAEAIIQNYRVEEFGLLAVQVKDLAHNKSGCTCL